MCIENCMGFIRFNVSCNISNLKLIGNHILQVEKIQFITNIPFDKYFIIRMIFGLIILIKIILQYFRYCVGFGFPIHWRTSLTYYDYNIFCISFLITEFSNGQKCELNQYQQSCEIHQSCGECLSAYPNLNTNQDFPNPCIWCTG